MLPAYALFPCLNAPSFWVTAAHLTPDVCPEDHQSSSVGLEQVEPLVGGAFGCARWLVRGPWFLAPARIDPHTPSSHRLALVPSALSSHHVEVATHTHHSKFPRGFGFFGKACQGYYFCFPGQDSWDICFRIVWPFPLHARTRNSRHIPCFYANSRIWPPPDSSIFAELPFHACQP